MMPSPQQFNIYHKEIILTIYTNSKGADQPANLHCLISTFFIGLLESIIIKLATIRISVC